VFTFIRSPLENYVNRLLKRVFDVTVSLLVILGVFTWLFPIVIIAIKATSKGPIFFKQKRSGINNSIFWVYKFRTMKLNRNSDKVQATKFDPRITKFGAFMRRTNIDEFPQFFNVLLGNMSIVGPRPHMLRHTEQYSELIDEYLERHYILPGITGWAQVHGYRGETRKLDQMQKRVEFDIWYAENWSFLLDIRIMFLTTKKIIMGDDNAY
jgi:exopolysaccharide biosynthesis polyprenyl glycosylphosphotransferase